MPADEQTHPLSEMTTRFSPCLPSMMFRLANMSMALMILHRKNHRLRRLLGAWQPMFVGVLKVPTFRVAAAHVAAEGASIRGYMRL